MSLSILIILLIILAIILYFLPAIAACSRGHNNSTPIFITNLFFGVSVIGWIVCVIWAFSDNVKSSKGVHYVEPIEPC